MRRIPVKFLREGSLIAQNIYDKNGLLLINEGSKVDSKTLNLLNQHNILSTYITDEHSPDKISEVLNSELRLKSVLELKKMAFTFVQSGAPKNPTTVSHENFERIKKLVTNIVDELLSKDILLIEGIDIRNFENYYFSHSVNVAVMSISLGIELKYDRQKLIRLGLAAILHDIGLVFLPHDILYKPTERTGEEEEIFKTHCQKGYDYLSKFENIDKEILEAVIYHHERVDGQGFPKGLSSKKLSDFSKIISIVDFYDELMSTGIMLKENLPNNVLEQIMAYVGYSFEYELVSVFYKKAVPFLKGTIIKLSNDDIALVEGTIKGFPLRPVVRIIKSNDKSKINKCISLVDNLSLSIVELVYYI